MNTYDNEGLYARFHTTQGPVTARLFFKETPLTVTAFVGLAQASIKNLRTEKPFYENTLFYEKQDSVYIAGGDFTGDGHTNPGYFLPDEVTRALPFDRAGRLALMNSGRPVTGGSHFFFTLAPAPQFNARNTVFGQLAHEHELETVLRLKVGDRLERVEIIRRGAEAEAFQADQPHFDRLYARARENVYSRIGQALIAQSGEEPQQDTRHMAMIDKLGGNFIQTPMGLFCRTLRPPRPEGRQPLFGQTITVHYEGRFLENNEVFDSSYRREAPYEFPVGTGFVIPCWDEVLLTMREGQKCEMVAPYQFAYGSEGTPSGIIGPKTWVVFEIELIEID
jgi:peptidyl-prolyl cis-trans isomerase A (cyclophilin A)